MCNSDIKEKRIKLFEEIKIPLADILALTLKYLEIFDKKDFFLFADKDKRAAIYKKEYRTFILQLSDPVKAISALMAGLSELFIEAERRVDSSAPILEDVFLSYLSFERTLTEFSSNTETILKNDAPSVSELSTEAKKLNSSITSLIQKIS